MKRREMNSLARSLCSYLGSRNNDIAGYRGIGMLCALSRRENKPKFSFKQSRVVCSPTVSRRVAVELPLDAIARSRGE